MSETNTAALRRLNRCKELREDGVREATTPLATAAESAFVAEACQVWCQARRLEQYSQA